MSITNGYLTEWSWIRISGEDRMTFLHAQLTNSISDLKDGESCFAGYCDPKGRLLATMHIVCTKDAHFMLLPTSLRDQTVKRLRMFILRSKVMIEDLTAITALTFCSEPPENADCLTVKISDDLYVAAIEQANAVNSPAGDQAFAHLLIKLGIPAIIDKTIGQFVPQWVNLDVVNGLNFKKGCYPGQEIVARTHYLGKLKKRMYLLASDSASQTAADANMPLYVPEQEQAIGTVVNTITQENHTIMLAVLRIEAAENTSTFLLDSHEGTPFTLGKLPYEFPAPRQPKG